MTKFLKDKNVLLTGASRGIGVVMAKKLAQEGANLIISSRSSSAKLLEGVAGDLRNMGVTVVTISADVTQVEDREKIFNESANKLGPIDILINNAGIENPAPFEETDLEVVGQMIKTNLIAPIELSRLAIHQMLENNGGHIINMASLAGRVPYVYNSIYTATKSGLISWTKAVSDEYRDRNIDFSVICPGFISEVGMHGVRKMKAPIIAKEITPEKVANSLIRTIRSKQVEVLISALPVRPLLGLWEWFPGIKNIVYKYTGLRDFMSSVSMWEKERSQTGPST